MRFYDDKWEKTIVSVLNKKKRILLCCQSRFLEKENNKVTENKTIDLCFGAFIDFHNPKNLLGATWTYKEFPETKSPLLSPIACVLGAGYACSKKYWQYLKGLDGLLYYGSDETYISLKVWLTGGECLLLKNVSIGHIYKKEFPYYTANLYPLYNRLIIAELLLPNVHKKYIHSISKLGNLTLYNEVLFLLLKNNEHIIYLKSYYKNIIEKDFYSFIKLNNEIQIKTHALTFDDEKLKVIAFSLITQYSTLNDIGLLQGKMGIIIFLYHYGDYVNEDIYKEFADYFLETLVNDFQIDQSTSFCSGLLGIGWGIEYLSQNGYIDGDTNEILEEIDEKITEINPLKIKNLGLHYGLGGIVHYLLSRLNKVNDKQLKPPIDKSFLHNVYLRIKYIIDNKINCDCLDIFIKYYLFYTENEIKQELELSLFDISPLYLPPYNEHNPKVGIDGGSTGLGLRFMFERDI